MIIVFLNFIAFAEAGQETAFDAKLLLGEVPIESSKVPGAAPTVQGVGAKVLSPPTLLGYPGGGAGWSPSL